jgi:hypothetical protein
MHCTYKRRAMADTGGGAAAQEVPEGACAASPNPGTDVAAAAATGAAPGAAEPAAPKGGKLKRKRTTIDKYLLASQQKGKNQTVDRSGAPPTFGCNKGLNQADRLAEAPRSSRARTRKLRTNQRCVMSL